RGAHGGVRSLAARELSEERQPIAGPEGRLESVRDAEHGVVDEHLDVLAELQPLPQRGVELRVARREPLQNAADGRARDDRLLEQLPTGPDPAAELRDPGDDLYRDRPHSSFPSHSDPRALQVAGRSARQRFPSRVRVVKMQMPREPSKPRRPPRPATIFATATPSKGSTRAGTPTSVGCTGLPVFKVLVPEVIVSSISCQRARWSWPRGTAPFSV